MTQENLEETTPKTEETEPTPKEEVKPTEAKKEPTVRMYDQKELDKAVGKGVSSIQSLLSISKATEETAKAELEVTKSLQEETERRMIELEEKQFTDDPEALKGFRLTKTLEVREKKANLRDAELNRKGAEQEGLRMAIILNNKATELQVQYQVPRKILELCTSEEQMDDIAKDYPEVKEKTEEEPEKKKPQFAGGGEGGAGDSASWERVREEFINNPDNRKNTGRYYEMRRAQGR